MPECWVYNNCKNNEQTENYSFITFPSRDRNPKLFKQWLYKIKKANFVPSKTSPVCSIHFKENDHTPVNCLYSFSFSFGT